MIIPQFRTDSVLINIGRRYQAWHTPGGAYGFPSRQIAMGKPGSGREFFQFHRTVLDEFFAWNAVHHAVETKDLVAWTAVPAELKVPETGWPTPWSGLDLAVAEIRIHTNLPPFANDDELGIFVESTILNWIHGAVAAAPAFNLDPVEQKVISGLQSPQSTWFYKIHGLADFWWNRLLFPKSHFKEIVDHCGSGRASKSEFKEIVDYGGSGKGPKSEFKEIVDYGRSGMGSKSEFKEIVDYGGSGKGPKSEFKEIVDYGGSGMGSKSEFKEIVDYGGSGKGPKSEFKEIVDYGGPGRGFKEVVDNPGGKDFKEIVDAYGGQPAIPSVLINLLQRIKALEARLRIKKSPFIKPFQRPNVGASVVRSRRKKNP